MSKQTIHSTPGYIEVIVIALLTAVISIAVYDNYFVQKIRFLDLKETLRTQKALFISGVITKAKWKENLDTIEASLDRQARKHPNQIILLKDVVLRNGDEIDIR